MKKSRFLYLHEEVNVGKVEELEALHLAYVAYLKECVETLFTQRRFSVRLSEKHGFFPSSHVLSSQIIKNAQDHASSIVSSWVASKYATTLKQHIKDAFKSGGFSAETRYALFTIGKRLVDKPSGKIPQEALDLYWSWLLDEEIVGKTPSISSRVGMRLSEMTSTFALCEKRLTSYWISFSHLQAGKPRIRLPLVPSPYVKDPSDVSKGFLARKTKGGRWRFEAVDKKEWEIPAHSEGAPKVGVDVGLNVMAATSDGLLLGQEVKPRFNRLYLKVQKLRRNRQQQKLRENSRRLDRLESKLTGLVRTAAGTAANKLIKRYPGYTFVLEDLDLRGCRGQKRFAYRALQHSLEAKAPTIKVNPAYTSQMCPSCGYVHRGNRSGTRFKCRACGRISHADVVGGINLLGRSEDKQIDLDTLPSSVKSLLRERFLQKRNSSLRGRPELVPSSQKLTVGVPSGTSIASNQGASRVARFKQPQATS